MKHKQRLAGAAALAAVLVTGGQFALAQTTPRLGAVQKGGVATMPPMSRPVHWGGIRTPQGVIATLMTENECTGLGGTVNSVPTATCDSGKGCVTAGKDGVMHGVCIDKAS